MRIVDFRSDTKTLPTLEMRKAMANAEVGDDVSGEDPSVNRLEEMAANLLGKDAGLLVSSGTMGNLVAILTHCQRGDEVIVGDQSHIVRGEAGGASVLGGVVLQTIPTDSQGMLDPYKISNVIKPDDFHFPRTSLIALENTHNSSGGSVLSTEYIKEVAKIGKTYGVPLHIDGARIFNASVFLKIPVSELVKDADTVSFCLSKGLSAPVGSLLCGSQEQISLARRWRKMLGGGMRQAGIIAAAGIIALESMVDRLAEDHTNARKLAIGLSKIPGISIVPNDLPTNLVFFGVPEKVSAKLVESLSNKGVMVGPRDDSKWRMVTHSGISLDDIEYALAVINDVFRNKPL